MPIRNGGILTQQLGVAEARKAHITFRDHEITKHLKHLKVGGSTPSAATFLLLCIAVIAYVEHVEQVFKLAMRP